MRWILASVLLISGCVPLPIYQELQKKLSATEARRNDLDKRLRRCEGTNKRLNEKLNETPKQMPAAPMKVPMTPAELEAIKKKALDEAERKFRERTGQPIQEQK